LEGEIMPRHWLAALTLAAFLGGSGNALAATITINTTMDETTTGDHLCCLRTGPLPAPTTRSGLPDS
jgi:hypothetical protein